MSEVMAAQRWGTNAAMIVDVARLGYLDGSVLDATYGAAGGFWKLYRPEGLVSSDLYEPADHAWDFTYLPCADGEFDAVVFDPPFKLNGRPTASVDDRYGVGERRSRDQRLDLIERGVAECFRVARRYLLVKCMDMVEGGKVRWQTDLVTRVVEAAGGRKCDRFDFLVTPRPQPDGRRQVTARRNYSTLLVFAK